LILHITPAERQTLQMLADGSPTDAIADHLGVRECEVETRLSTLFARIGAASKTAAIAVAFRRGLLVSSTRLTRSDGQRVSQIADQRAGTTRWPSTTKRVVPAPA
jgi:DNA-binding CsgD family transcriptional regulator